MGAAGMTNREAIGIAKTMNKPIGIKQLLLVAEMAKQGSGDGKIDTNVFRECLHTVGY